jgi:hypothetical protein
MLMSSLRQPGDLLKWAEWQLKRKMQLTLPQGMLKKRDVADEDNEVRTTVEAQVPVAVKWVLRDLLFALRFYSQIWPSTLLQQSSRKGGRVGSHLTSSMWLWTNSKMFRR